MTVIPPAHERKYFSHRYTGDRGYLVSEDGEFLMRYDRPMGPNVPWKKDQWVEANNVFPMSKMQVAEMAYGLVSRFFYYNGQHAKARRKWETLREEERIHWMNKGPTDPGAKKWFDAIMEVGKEFHS